MEELTGDGSFGLSSSVISSWVDQGSCSRTDVFNFFFFNIWNFSIQWNHWWLSNKIIWNMDKLKKGLVKKQGVRCSSSWFLVLLSYSHSRPFLTHLTATITVRAGGPGRLRLTIWETQTEPLFWSIWYPHLVNTGGILCFLDLGHGQMKSLLANSERKQP